MLSSVFIRGHYTSRPHFFVKSFRVNFDKIFDDMLTLWADSINLNLMTFASAPGAFKKFKRTPWRFQQTFRTPLKDLDRFVETILATARIEHCTITIDEVLFDPKNVRAALPHANIALNHDFSIEADGEEVKKLLAAAFSDWIDFLFVPGSQAIHHLCGS
jgi:hypothetical protein